MNCILMRATDIEGIIAEIQATLMWCLLFLPPPCDDVTSRNYFNYSIMLAANECPVSTLASFLLQKF